MSIYVVGDIQGCLSCLEKLLDSIGFNPPEDQLWSVGDLVNRGPSSLETLRFCKNLGSSFRTVLGNHDLSLLAMAQGVKKPSRKDTIQAILTAPDREDLLDWLVQQPILLSHKQYTLVHAGIPPQWSLPQAQGYAAELEATLSNPEQREAFFKGMFGNTPTGWQESMQGIERLRAITNYFTRMRYCDSDGNLEFNNKQAPQQGPADYKPWFAHPHRKTASNAIVFGHWASLDGHVEGNKLFALDTGCVWGGRMRIMALESQRYFHQHC